jgi:TolB protein
MRNAGRHLTLPLAVLAVTLGICPPALADEGEPRSTIAFTSNRDDPDPAPANWEIWLMDGDGTNPRRLTFNTGLGFGDFMPVLSPDGKGKIVFDSTRTRVVPGEPPNTSALFLMNHDGTEETFLTRGSSATWSPVGPNGSASKNIAFHRSASFIAPPVVGQQRPIRPDPGAPAFDSDIFVVNVDDLLENGEAPRNLTNNGALFVEDDANWSPDGTKIAYTRHPHDDSHTNSVRAEICVIDANGAGEPTCILGETVNEEEERGPAWSPDGTRFAYMCRKGDPATPTGTIPTFEICVINADGTNERRLTTNNLLDGTPQWSPDGLRILFSRGPNAISELWLIDADGLSPEEQFTSTDGFNIFANWGQIAVGHDE